MSNTESGSWLSTLWRSVNSSGPKLFYLLFVTERDKCKADSDSVPELSMMRRFSRSNFLRYFIGTP